MVAVAVAGYGHEQGADDENAAYLRVPPRLLAIVLPHHLCWPRRLSHRPATSLQAIRQPSWLFSGPYTWYGVLAIGNVHFRPPVVALATPTPAATAPSLELALSTTAPDSNNAPQVCYTAQEIEVHSLEDLELTVFRISTVQRAPPN